VLWLSAGSPASRNFQNNETCRHRFSSVACLPPSPTPPASPSRLVLPKARFTNLTRPRPHCHPHRTPHVELLNHIGATESPARLRVGYEFALDNNEAAVKWEENAQTSAWRPVPSPARYASSFSPIRRSHHELHQAAAETDPLTARDRTNRPVRQRSRQFTKADAIVRRRPP
jgi:hypothetical protein